ncbi:hypothetical protein HZH66_003082 [Vespula vulgaris]|uniref:Uncharacterized protein n=1 Tax=Vespula vulgaris TaxID=7454 RepID=A0A834NGV0_VESVU|nr:hypothetical protein HZH66_003082 [Vespula vulgaris]
MEMEEGWRGTHRTAILQIFTLIQVSRSQNEMQKDNLLSKDSSIVSRYSKLVGNVGSELPSYCMQVPTSLIAFAGADTDTESVRNILWHVIPVSERKTIGDFIVLLFEHVIPWSTLPNISTRETLQGIPFKSKMTRPLSKSRLSTITISTLSTL